MGKKREKKFVGSVFKHLPVFILERTVMGKCAAIQSISGTPLSPPARKKKKIRSVIEKHMCHTHRDFNLSEQSARAHTERKSNKKTLH